MSYIHSRVRADAGDIISVQCSHQINVLVMDDTNYNRYKSGNNPRVLGGFYTHFPANIEVPSSGGWNVVLALPPGRKASIKYSINVIG
ncbi:DUF1883 domain-containing protein [Pectobacterium parmentieri]|uniref:DUF1883 domain-containing protein n=1 Tax=Pectobacterium parmentieri TaxID=1905730 RepID=UPI000F8C70C1|nr:DUF1883 domain-containing protein [Pectobacterium parmentieri]AZS56809.1 DUF1883 domain-containing protein [Pectobacterium parmentieri]